MSTSTIPNHVLGGWGKKVHHRHRDTRHCSVSHHSPPTTYTTEAHAAHNHLVTDRPPRAATAEGGGVTVRLAESRAHRTVASSTLAWLVIGNFSTGSGNFSGPSARRRSTPSSALRNRVSPGPSRGTSGSHVSVVLVILSTVDRTRVAAGCTRFFGWCALDKPPRTTLLCRLWALPTTPLCEAKCGASYRKKL